MTGLYWPHTENQLGIIKNSLVMSVYLEYPAECNFIMWRTENPVLRIYSFLQSWKNSFSRTAGTCAEDKILLIPATQIQNKLASHCGLFLGINFFPLHMDWTNLLCLGARILFLTKNHWLNNLSMQKQINWRRLQYDLTLLWPNLPLTTKFIWKKLCCLIFQHVKKVQNTVQEFWNWLVAVTFLGP